MLYFSSAEELLYLLARSMRFPMVTCWMPSDGYWISLPARHTHQYQKALFDLHVNAFESNFEMNMYKDAKMAIYGMSSSPLSFLISFFSSVEIPSQK